MITGLTTISAVLFIAMAIIALTLWLRVAQLERAMCVCAEGLTKLLDEKIEEEKKAKKEKGNNDEERAEGNRSI